MISITEWQSECGGPAVGGWAGAGCLGEVGAEMPLPAGLSLWEVCEVTSGASGPSCRVGILRAVGPWPGVAPRPARGCDGSRPPGSQRLVLGEVAGSHSSWCLSTRGPQTWGAAKVDPGGHCPFRHLSQKTLLGSPMALGPFLPGNKLNAAPQITIPSLLNRLPLSLGE